MERIYQYLAMSLGAVAGTLLFYIGFRKLFKNEESLKEKSLFTLSVALVITMLAGEAGCTNSKPAQPQEAAQVKKTAEAQKAKRPEQTVQPQRTEEPEKMKEFARKAELLEKTKEWSEFRELWQRLDRIETFKKAEGDKPPLLRPGIDRKLYEDLSQKLNEKTAMLDTLVEKRLLSPKIASLLKKISRDRLEHILTPDPHMLCRMMPTPAMRAKPETFSHLETRIDALLKLKGEGKIKESTFRKATQNIENAIAKLVVLDLIPRHYTGPLLTEKEDIVKTLVKEIASLESLYKSAAMGAKAYERFKKQMEELGITTGKFEELLDELNYLILRLIK